ncbi:MAG: aminodeoxychorismate lyase [Rheinheimera sp.]|uniref:endolytic transglycosylase MltG n=1 Tax=Arsukibacterium sp. UBA3155 TaxID=1946058 RepID=UPI000C89AC62|nr:endolytic transglycosylase MltG [Arsukibacterium sp. UBA3155]MAD76128.1 aminodeoxychorismate lyase [Rheinheimera sp.]|tara:strand:- start:11006 stop:12022 length:1017 start_codon:yes stop_codon:yes gene_type:complete
MLKKLLLLLLIATVALALLLRLGVSQLQQRPVALAEPYFNLQAGSSARGLCQQWLAEGQLKPYDCYLLRLYLKWQPELAQLRQGTYRNPKSATLLSLLRLFASGEVAQFSLTFIEGETAQQALLRLQGAEYLQQDLNSTEQMLELISWPADWGAPPQHPEGLLFADTYFYTANSAASALVKRAQQALLRQLDDAWQQRQGELPLQNRYQLLIMASLIEKESGLLAEKSLVSSVFVNRLHRNMRLQTDPTVIYGLTNYSGRITYADLRNPHPYNTYRHHGLPPGPISLVGASALQAAAQPDNSDYFYFVSRGDGSHVFSVTLEQHNAAVRKYILGKNDD